MKNQKDIEVRILGFSKQDLAWAKANNLAVETVAEYIGSEGLDESRWSRLARELDLTDDQFRAMIQSFTFRDQDGEAPDDPEQLSDKLKERGYSFTCGLAAGILFEQFRSGTRSE